MLALDGKTLRGTIPAGHSRGVHLLAASLPKQGIVLVQAPVDRKENEIVVVPTLLARLPLAGVVVVGDALHTQRATCRIIVESNGDYRWFVDKNQPRLRWDISQLFAEQIKARSAIRRSLDQLEAIDVPLGQTVELFVCERPQHCILVAYQASGKLHQFWQPTCLNLC